MGNRRLRVLVNLNLQRYAEAKTRVDKSNVIDLIVRQIREAAGPTGGFVKKDPDGEWFVVGNSLARDKVGHQLRDLQKGKK